ncbi:MAG: hypothetical protein ACJA1I_002658 [Zhongshania marina]|nr:hypothetical protein [Gammaproteobacteria bacterium]
MKKVILLMSAVVLLAACTTANLLLDSRFLASADYFPVTGRQGWLLNQRLGFGTFVSGKVDRDWDTTDTLAIGSFESVRQAGAYRFSFSDGEDNVAQLDCKNGDDTDHVNLRGMLGGDARWIVDGDSFLNCSILEWGETFSWKLLMSSKGELLRGYLYSENKALPVYEVLSSVELEGAAWAIGEIAGYLVYRDGVQVAAIQVVNEGGVWVGNRLPLIERRRLASLAAALLLYRPSES